MDTLHIAIQLAKCESESEVKTFLKQLGIWDNPKYWRAFGDNDNNWSTIGNQQSDADAALVEKIVNSVDALLMKECLVHGISPTSEKAPKSIANALEAFFGITGGKIQNLTESQRTQLAQDNIILAATGTTDKPNYTIVDRGEGQTPQRMPETILSINKSNKLKVPFVQGKFNMGGTGVLSFCGNENFQLIISRRCPDIAESGDESQNLWGITLIRRERPYDGSGLRSSKFTYLVDEDNQIMSFCANEGIDIIPSSKRDKNGYMKYQTMHYGMFCKMFEYQMPSKLRTNINMGLNSRLSMLLPNLAYPVYLDECREYKGHTMFRTLSGLNVRLSDQISKEDSNIEDKVTVSFYIEGQKIDAAVYIFKQKNANGNKVDMSQYRGTEGVLLVQNGQTHSSYDKKFYTRSKVGLSYLADSLLTIVDCSAIDEATREELFMNSRDRTRSSSFSNTLEKNLEDYLKNNETLKLIQAKRRDEAITEKLDDEKPLEDILSSVFKSSSVLSRLFVLGEKLKNPTSFMSSSSADKYEGKYNPSFFAIARKKHDESEVYEKEAQLGRKFRIKFRTDANNDFFSREKYPGIYSLVRTDSCVIENHSLNLRDGIAVLNIELPPNAKKGDIYNYTFIVKDTNVEKEFVEHFVVNVIEQKDESNGRGDRARPSGNKRGNKGLAPRGIALPHVEEVSCDKWDDHDFTKYSALKVMSAGNGGYDFYVNIDNIHLQTELKTVAQDASRVKLLKARYKYTMVMVGLSILSYYKEHNDAVDTDAQFDSPESEIKHITEMISPIILPVISVMGGNMEDII